jgi:hypothetical protein
MEWLDVRRQADVRERVKLMRGVVFLVASFVNSGDARQIMGNAPSTAATSASVTSAVANTMLAAVQNCGASASGSQGLNVSGTGNTVTGVNQSQNISINLSCLSDTSTIQAMQTSISNAITQQVTQSSVALLSIGMPAAAAASAISNEVTNNFTSSAIQNCMTGINGSQNVSVSGTNNVVSGVTQAQALTSISNCAQKILNNMSTVTTATNAADQALTNTSTNPLDFLSSIFSSITTTVALAIGGVITVIILVIVLIASGGHHSSGMEQMSGFMGPMMYMRPPPMPMQPYGPPMQPYGPPPPQYGSPLPPQQW